MKTQKQVTMIHRNHTGMQIVSLLDFSKLSNYQKKISSSLFTLNEGNSRKIVFSVEDIYHQSQGGELLRKEIFDSTSFLAAYIIPFGVQRN
jgi:hypothetical protein